MKVDWWTLGIQLVNVLVLVWLLGRFFWRPVAALIEERRAAAQRVLADAEAVRSEAERALADVEKTRAGLQRERLGIVAAAHETAEHASTAVLASAARHAASLEASARVAIEKENHAARKEWEERASRLAVAIAERLVARLDGPAVSDAFLQWLLHEIRALPASARQAVVADGGVLEAVSAAPIEPADQERYRAQIGEALGGRPDILFRVEPSLVAGLELRGPHLVISNSWRADLDRILADLSHDER